MDLLDAGDHGYLIKVKLKGLAQLLAQQHWTPVPRQPGREQCVFPYRANDRTQARFFVAVRCRKESPDDHPQGELLPIEDYDYFCWRFWGMSTRLGAKPRQQRAPAISEKLACTYAPEGLLGCAVMARTRLGSGIARDLKI